MTRVTDAGVTLTHTVSGGGYGSTTVPDVEVSITENDEAGIVLGETGPHGGGGRRWGVELHGQAGHPSRRAGSP